MRGKLQGKGRENNFLAEAPVETCAALPWHSMVESREGRVLEARPAQKTQDTEAHTLGTEIEKQLSD